MRVKAIRDHFDQSQTLRKAGDEFEHEGKLHEHIKKADKPAPEPETVSAETEAAK